MTTFPLRIQLKDNTYATVTLVTNNSFDFDLILPNGSKRSFRWRQDSPHSFLNRKGEIDQGLEEVIAAFLSEWKSGI